MVFDGGGDGDDGARTGYDGGHAVDGDNSLDHADVDCG